MSVQDDTLWVIKNYFDVGYFRAADVQQHVHGASVQSVRTALAKLTNEGFLQRIEQGLYELVEEEVEERAEPVVEEVEEVKEVTLEDGLFDVVYHLLTCDSTEEDLDYEMVPIRAVLARGLGSNELAQTFVPVLQGKRPALDALREVTTMLNVRANDRQDTELTEKDEAVIASFAVSYSWLYGVAPDYVDSFLARVFKKLIEGLE